MTTKDTEFVVQAAGIPCPKCHEASVDVLRPDMGMLEFRCSGCGHQWLLFDRSPQDDSER
jgi:uncharacterized Zn finger protein